MNYVIHRRKSYLIGQHLKYVRVIEFDENLEERGGQVPHGTARMKIASGDNFIKLPEELLAGRNSFQHEVEVEVICLKIDD